MTAWHHNFDTSKQKGKYKICVTNIAKDAKPIDVEYQLETGISAVNYDDLVQKKHLLPIELQAQKIQDFVEITRNSIAYLANEEALL